MYVRKKINKSGSTSVVVVDKSSGCYKEIHSLGTSKDSTVISQFVIQGKKWIRDKELEHNPEFDFEGHENQAKEEEMRQTQEFISRIDNVLINGTQLILDKVFDSVGFNAIDDVIFRHLVLSRLSFPSSKLATTEYLKNYYDEDVSLNKIYRYLDKLDDTMQKELQNISVNHTINLFGGKIGVVFYDVTTLYFESDHEDELRKTGFSKEGRHSNPQIILGLLVSINGYPLAYTIHEGNKYEGHTMLPVIKDFVEQFGLKDFIVVADSGLMNTSNIEELESLNYKYIIGARIKNCEAFVKSWILSQPKKDREMVEYKYNENKRLLIGYTDSRARKDSYNRDKGIKRLEKAYAKGQFSKSNLNKKGYNKFLEIKDEVNVSINYDKIQEDSKWDGLKGYITNTKIPSNQVYEAYHNLWNVEKAFRIAKSKIDIRPMFHFTKKRINAHVCICFVALKVYKELERLLKNANIELSVDKVISMSKTVTTLKVVLPLNKELLTKTILLKRHTKIALLFQNKFWVAQTSTENQ